MNFCIIYRRLGKIIRGYKDSLEIHIESNVNRFRTQNFSLVEMRLTQRIYIIYVIFHNYIIKIMS